MTSSNFASLTVWDDSIRGSYGPGVSHAREGERTRPITVLVRQQAARPMRVTLQAKTKADAIKFARNRWPGAAVEVAA